jgi:hypothetical protein
MDFAITRRRNRGGRRRASLALAVALLAVAAVALAVPGGPAGGISGAAVTLVELDDDPPFRIALGGPLWQDRTLQDGDAQDFAQVVADRPLEVEVRGSARVRVAEVELRVDGRRQQRVKPPCDQGRCPSSLRLTLTPRLRQLDPGDHRVEVVARDSRGAMSVQGFSVRTVGQVPAVTEGEPVGTLPAESPPRRDAGLESAALRVLESERWSGGLAQALGSARLTVIQVGDLNARGQRLGATMLVDLGEPRRDLWASVPGYTPVEADSGPAYTPQRVRMHVAVLRDALIDIDLGRRRVVAFEPGPRSRSLSWSPSRAPALAGASEEICPCVCGLPSA